MKIDHLLEVLKGDKAHLIYSGLAFLAGVLLVGLLYQYIVKKLTDRAKRLHARIDYFVVQVLRVPPPSACSYGLPSACSARVSFMIPGLSVHQSRFTDPVN